MKLAILGMVKSYNHSITPMSFHQHLLKYTCKTIGFYGFIFAMVWKSETAFAIIYSDNVYICTYSDTWYQHKVLHHDIILRVLVIMKSKYLEPNMSSDKVKVSCHIVDSLYDELNMFICKLAMLMTS